MDYGHRNKIRWPNPTLLTYTSPGDGPGEGERGVGCHVGEPKGRPRMTEVRRASSSAGVSARLTAVTH